MLLTYRAAILRRCISSYVGQPAPWSHNHMMSEDDVTPGISYMEYRNRRETLMKLLSMSQPSNRNKLVIFASNAVSYMSGDVPYPFHQNSNFWYLTGSEDPMAILTLQGNDGSQYKETLFVEHVDSEKAVWEGFRAGSEGSKQLLRIDDCRPLNEFSEFIQSIRNREVYCDTLIEKFHPSFFSLISSVLSSTKTKSIQLTIEKLRSIKSEPEVNLLRRSSKIISTAMLNTMKVTEPGISENVISSNIHHNCVMQGAKKLAYPSVVAGGVRGNTLHYINNDHILDDGETVLVDAGCDFSGYSSDLTRTWPVNGRFSHAQKVIYEMILDINKSCIASCSPEVSLNDLLAFMWHELGLHLKSLGIDMPDSREGLIKAASKYCVHHVGHHLGIDVHDCPNLSRYDRLAPGNVITIEPGVYLNFPDVPKEFRGLAVRIEDDVLVTETGCEVLTNCPKEISELENICNK